MTLTTERQQFEEWFHEEIVLHISTSHEAVVRLMWKAWQASRELLANRVAQPIKNTVLFEHSGCGYGAQIDMVTVKLNRGDVVVQIPGNIKKVINEKGEQSAVIYTATPAPAIPDIGSSVVNDAAWKFYDTLTEHGPLNGHQFNNLKSCLYESLKIVMSAPPAPAVPDALANDIDSDDLHCCGATTTAGTPAAPQCWLNR
ncbi:hypothetical protein [Serratia marcescens]|uniref:hypothetical protein n=1 Tax=Serratia marcescens TaxID=615 RepID=UPI002029C05C|nr:hypothetical protein [Serratia marcescens]